MSIITQIEVFEKLGVFLGQFSNPGEQETRRMPWLEELNSMFFRPVESVIKSSHIHNPWFTEENVRYAIKITGRSLNRESMTSWLSNYSPSGYEKKPKTVAVVIAGNIPMVGFHDMMCVLISGHNLLAKLSARDDGMLQIIADILCYLDDRFEGRISFEEGRLKDFDAVIATGSDNTARYFEYYFGKYPNIIRKNRNSVAILDGTETDEELKGLADDVFRYFGLGCRSVSKLYIPENYNFERFIEISGIYKHFINHNHWANNYEYQRAIHLINQSPHLDTGFFLIREDTSPSSPISVINYVKTEDTEIAVNLVKREIDKLQCIVGKSSIQEFMIPFGKAQNPELNDYPDNVDTLEFLFNL